MKDIEFIYCSEFRYVDSYYIRDIYKNSMTVFFHIKNGSPKSVFCLSIYKENGKLKFKLIAINVDNVADYVFEFRFQNDINALAIFNDLCRDNRFASEMQRLVNDKRVIKGVLLPNNKKSDIAIINKYIYPLSKEATLQDVLNVLPKEIDWYNEFYMNDSYIGYRGSRQIREPIHFEGGVVYAAQRLLIYLISNTLV